MSGTTDGALAGWITRKMGGAPIEARRHPRFSNEQLAEKDPRRAAALIAGASRSLNAARRAAGQEVPLVRAPRPERATRGQAAPATTSPVSTPAVPPTDANPRQSPQSPSEYNRMVATGSDLRPQTQLERANAALNETFRTPTERFMEQQEAGRNERNAAVTERLRNERIGRDDPQSSFGRTLPAATPEQMERTRSTGTRIVEELRRGDAMSQNLARGVTPSPAPVPIPAGLNPRGLSFNDRDAMRRRAFEASDNASRSSRTASENPTVAGHVSAAAAHGAAIAAQQTYAKNTEHAHFRVDAERAIANHATAQRNHTNEAEHLRLNPPPPPPPPPAPLPALKNAADGKDKIPNRTPAERAAVMSHNANMLISGAAGVSMSRSEAERTAKNLDALFGKKSPRLDEIVRGYGAKGYDSKISSFSVSPTDMSISMKVKNPNATAAEKSAGKDHVTDNFSRSITKNADGTMSVYHAHFVVNPRYRSSSVGTQLLSNSIRFQHEVGMRKLATSPAGSYGRHNYEQWSAHQANQRSIQAHGSGKAEDHQAVAKQLRDVAKVYRDKADAPGQSATQAHAAREEANKHESRAAEHLEHAASGKPADKPEVTREKLHSASANYDGHAYGGPRAWSGMGFQWSKHEGDNIGSRFSSYLQEHHGMSRVDATAAADRVKQHPREIGKYTAPNGKNAGAHFMSEHVGNSEDKWRVEMKASDKGWQHMKSKLGLTDLVD